MARTLLLNLFVHLNYVSHGSLFGISIFHLYPIGFLARTPYKIQFLISLYYKLLYMNSGRYTLAAGTHKRLNSVKICSTIQPCLTKVSNTFSEISSRNLQKYTVAAGTQCIFLCFCSSSRILIVQIITFTPTCLQFRQDSRNSIFLTYTVSILLTSIIPRKVH